MLTKWCNCYLMDINFSLTGDLFHGQWCKLTWPRCLAPQCKAWTYTLLQQQQLQLHCCMVRTLCKILSAKCNFERQKMWLKDPHLVINKATSWAGKRFAVFCQLQKSSSILCKLVQFGFIWLFVNSSLVLVTSTRTMLTKLPMEASRNIRATLKRG